MADAFFSADMSNEGSRYRPIGEVATLLRLQPHVLRFWETKFKQISPLKRSGGRRYYRREDVRLLFAIRDLLYVEGYTLRGAQKVLRERLRAGLESGSPKELRSEALEEATTSTSKEDEKGAARIESAKIESEEPTGSTTYGNFQSPIAITPATRTRLEEIAQRLEQALAGLASSNDTTSATDTTSTADVAYNSSGTSSSEQ